MLDQFYLFIVSLISNIFSAFSGGGAGVIQLPAILFIFNIPFANALSVHKIATVALGVGASIRFLKSMSFDKKFFLQMILVGGPAVILGAQYIYYLNDTVARLLLGLFIIGISIYSFISKDHGVIEQQYKPTLKNNFLGYILIFVIGFTNGSLSAGTGLLFTICMVSWYGMDYKKAIAYTLIIVGLFYNAIGAITLAMYVDIDWNILPALLLGSLIGGYVGAHISLSKDSRTIKIVYQIVTLLVGAKLVLYL